MKATDHLAEPASSTTRRVQKARNIPVFRGKPETPAADSSSTRQRYVCPPRPQTVVGIAAIETALGSRLVSNEEIAAQIPTLDAQNILKLTGIEYRRWASDHETALTLGTHAARKVLDSVNMTIGEVDLLLCCTGTPQQVTPSMACLILGALSATSRGGNVAACDVNAACSGYLYTLQMAYDYLQSCPHHSVLIVTTETLSRRIKRTDAATAPIFGDAASATLLQGQAYSEHLRAQVYRPVLSAKGDDAETLCVPTHNHDAHVTMKGQRAFREAVRAMIMILHQACAQARMRPEELSLIVPHQSNQRIIDAVRRRLLLPKDRVFSNIRNIGNTSSSSIPICLEQLLEERESDDLLGLCAFGGGFTYGGAILRML